jgi:hypothetical protein
MKGLSVFQKLGALCLALAVCVAVVGCGGHSVDELLEEAQAIDAERAAARGNRQELRIVKAKQDEWEQKYNSLSDMRKMELLARRSAKNIKQP